MVSNISTFYVKNNQVNKDIIKIIGNDVKHLKNVLRYKEGDKLEVCDESEKRYYTSIKNITNEEIELEILDVDNDSREMNVKVTLYQGLPKSDKMELVIQKCTELGVSQIVPVITDRVVVKIDEKNENKKIERWNKIGMESAKQSGRQAIPKIEKIVNLENIIENLSKYDIVIVPYECEKDCTLKAILKNIEKEIKSIAIVIGPEGGFSDKDIEILERCTTMKKVSLGKRILRTETAGIATMAMILYEYEL